MRFYVASQRVVPCLYVFVSLVFVLTASATSQHNAPQQVGVLDKDSTTINYTCCKDLSVNAFFHVRATHLLNTTARLGRSCSPKMLSIPLVYIYYIILYIVRRVHIVHMRMRGNYLRDICTVYLGAFAIRGVEERPWRQPRAGDESSLALSSIYT